MAKETYYDILGIREDATETEIKQAYRKLVRKYHPDVSKEANADEMTSKINQAYNVLKNKDKRAEYDLMLSHPFTDPPKNQYGFDFNNTGKSSPHSRREDFRFDDIFSAFSANQQGFRQERGPLKGSDQHAELVIDINAAYQGAKRRLNLNIPVFNENGQLIQQQKTLEVTIPKGISEGQQIRLNAQGLPGINGGKPGDLFLKIHFRESQTLYVDNQKDVHMQLDVKPWQLALAEQITIDTPAGKFTLQLPENGHQGQKIRLKDKGIPAKVPGDLYVHLNIVMPKISNSADKAAWQALAAHYKS